MLEGKILRIERVDAAAKKEWRYVDRWVDLVKDILQLDAHNPNMQPFTEDLRPAASRKAQFASAFPSVAVAVRCAV